MEVDLCNISYSSLIVLNLNIYPLDIGEMRTIPFILFLYSSLVDIPRTGIDPNDLLINIISLKLIFNCVMQKSTTSSKSDT